MIGFRTCGTSPQIEHMGCVSAWAACFVRHFYSDTNFFWCWIHWKQHKRQFNRTQWYEFRWINVVGRQIGWCLFSVVFILFTKLKRFVADERNRFLWMVRRSNEMNVCECVVVVVFVLVDFFSLSLASFTVTPALSSSLITSSLSSGVWQCQRELI